LDLIVKLDPVETACAVGETVRFEGNEAATMLAVLMLTTTLPVEPPFFLIEILVEETCMLHSGGPLSPGAPPGRSKQGVLSIAVVPETIVCDLMLVDPVIPGL